MVRLSTKDRAMSVESMSTSSSSHNMDISSNFAKKTLQDYEVVSVIGNGAFGTCFKVRDKETGHLYAWKAMDYDELSEVQKESLVSEIRVLRQLQHPNIVQYFHHLVNYESKSIFIVMECCEGGDLAQLIAKAKAENKRFEERYIWRLLFQVCHALQVCHNKIKNGTILHRDVKPANIFLDMQGNAKLGDFGLARMLRRNESFAKTFVGTPYYMSPEIVKGFKYDRKSDVWATGCLIYEMCSLRPPFKGKEFTQLSTNIANGTFSKIPQMYSKDLQEIIALMLEVDNEKRHSIEIIIRHPVLVRNIYELGNEFPQLIDIEADDQHFNLDSRLRCKLEYGSLHDFSTTMFSEQNSFHEGYGQRQISITNVFTPDLRSELFYSANRRVFSLNPKLQFSDPELYESIGREEEIKIIDETIQTEAKQLKREYKKEFCVDRFSRDIFDSELQHRLHAIRAQESLLRQREEVLNTREQQLNDKEKRLIALEQSLAAKLKALDKENVAKTKPVSGYSSGERSRMPLPEVKTMASLPTPPPISSLPPSTTTKPRLPPPIPPRKPQVKHDETYCTIEPSDLTLNNEPTVAKLNLAALPASKMFPTLRKVTFQSPKKFITYDIESKTSKPTIQVNNINSMQSSVLSKGSDDSNENSNSRNSNSSSTNRRKSILSIFGLSRNNKDERSAKQTPTNVCQLSANPERIVPQVTTQEDVILSKCETSELTNIWTKEHKKAAFEMLAALNAERTSDTGEFVSNATRHRLRQSVRERSTLQRNRMRRSLMITGPAVGLRGVAGEKIIV